MKTNVFRYKMISLIYDSMELLYFNNKKTNPRYNLARIIPNTNLKILDVCVGTATSSIILAKKNQLNDITGIDTSLEMMNLAKKKIIIKNIDNIKIITMDATNIDFNDQEFDIVTISLALHEMPKDILTKVLNEIHRVLKNSGSLYIIEWEPPSHGIINKFLFFIIRVLEPSWFNEFLQTNWGTLLSHYNFSLQDIESCSFTKLIKANKS